MFMFTQTLLPHGSMEGQQPEYVPGEGGVEQNHCLITSTIKEMSYNIPVRIMVPISISIIHILM